MSFNLYVNSNGYTNKKTCIQLKCVYFFWVQFFSKYVGKYTLFILMPKAIVRTLLFYQKIQISTI